MVCVPESATVLYTGGFIRSQRPEVQRAAQRAIFNIQRSLETCYETLHPGLSLVCDRGILDGSAYWPEGVDAFFANFGTTRAEELARYAAVIFLETSAAGNFMGTKGNACRFENREQAIRIDEKLRGIYHDHPRFHFVSHVDRFEEKLSACFSLVDDLLGPAVGVDRNQSPTHAISEVEVSFAVPAHH